MTAVPGLSRGKLKDLTILREGPLARALAALNGSGEETRLVGGAVRDLALGEAALDFDLATTAVPGEAIRRARAAGFKVALTGVKHGTVTIIVDGRPIETTTLREDVETDGRHARVVFGRDFAADARRRDFTINALSLGPDGTVHDTVGGLADLAARRVRFIGEPEQRIREDYLRILRFFRFSARYAGGELDRDGLMAAIRLRDGLGRLSRERVRAELMKLIAAPRASEVVQTMGESGFLEPILGGVGYTRRLSRLIAIEGERGDGPDPLLRLGALAVVIPEDAERLRERLRLANAEADRLGSVAAALIPLHGAPPPSFDGLKALLFSAGRESARDALTLAYAESEAPPSDAAFAAADRFLADAPEPRLPLSGADLIARGVAAGPPVGQTLRAFQALWIRAGFPKEPEMLNRLIEQAVAQSGTAAGRPEPGARGGGNTT
ncbi:MAG TPA: CCA tRNA nucleotidyltransferase [Roseiarcus sp.]|jgi:poly(A) polymerase